jgi:hypothetical protein
MEAENTVLGAPIMHPETLNLFRIWELFTIDVLSGVLGAIYPTQNRTCLRPAPSCYASS